LRFQRRNRKSYFGSGKQPLPTLQINVITLGSMGDGFLPMRFQERFCSSSALLLRYGVTYKTKKKKNNIYKNMRATCGSSKELLEKMPIYRAAKNLIAFQT
jgi:hypothetical protein